MNTPFHVFVPLAEHPVVHPIPLRVFSSSSQAETHAFFLTQLLWDNSSPHNLTIHVPTLDTWRTTIADLGELYGNDECYLEIIECPLDSPVSPRQKHLYNVTISHGEATPNAVLSGWAFDQGSVQKVFPDAVSWEEVGTAGPTPGADIHFDLTELAPYHPSMGDSHLLALAALACEVSAQSPLRLKTTSHHGRISLALIEKIRAAMTTAKIDWRKGHGQMRL